jgi:hypothetical protein
MGNSEVLIGTTEYVILYTRCPMNRCNYNRVRLCIIIIIIIIIIDVEPSRYLTRI